MTTRVEVQHSSCYQFDREVALSPHLIRLRPAAHSRTPIGQYSLKVTPGDHYLHWQQDPFGNFIARLVFSSKTTSLKIDVRLEADLVDINPFDFFLEDYVTHWPFHYSPQLADDLAPYLIKEEAGPELFQFIDRQSTTIQSALTLDFLVQLNARLPKEINYVVREEEGVQHVDSTLQMRSGSCRDISWLLIQILRHSNIAARFVSGYLLEFDSGADASTNAALSETNRASLHAWVEVYLPGAGWIGLDPTSGIFAGSSHIPLACTSMPWSAAPVEGSTDPCKVLLSVSSSIKKL